MDIRRCPFQQGVTNVNIPSSRTTTTYFQIHGCLEVYLQFAESQRYDRIYFGIWTLLRMCMLSHEIHVTHWPYSIPNNFIFILRKHMLSSEICRRCMSASAVTLCKAFSKSSPWGPKKHFSQVTPSSFQIWSNAPPCLYETSIWIWSQQLHLFNFQSALPLPDP